MLSLWTSILSWRKGVRRLQKFTVTGPDGTDELPGSFNLLEYVNLVNLSIIF